jgi:putative membrane protein
VTCWENGHMDNGLSIVMTLGMLGTWALVTVAIAWIIRSTRTPPATPPMPPVSATGLAAAGSVTASAEQILAERLARGDIDPEEYRTRLEALTSRGTR